MAQQSGERIVAGLFAALLVEQGLVERQRAQAHEVQQHSALLGADQRGSGHRDHANPVIGDLQRETLPAIVESGRLVTVTRGTDVARRAPAGQEDDLAAAVDQHDAGRHGRFGDQRVGNPPPDGVELERADERCGELLQTVQLFELVLHPAVEQAVLDRQGDAVGDRAQLGRLRVLERLLAPAHEQHQPERLFAHQQAHPGRMPRRVGLQPVGQRQLVGRSDADRPQPDDLLHRGQLERLSGQVGDRDAPVGHDAQPGLGVEEQECDIGEEQLADLDRHALHGGLQVPLVAEHGDHLREPGGPHQRLGHQVFGLLEPVPQR
jgi:hypothetical protein